MIKLILFTTFTSVFLLSSCAKKVEPEDDRGRESVRREQIRIDEDIHTFFKTQSVICGDGCKQSGQLLDIAGSVAKLVVYQRSKVRFCTGVLIGKDLIVTSSNCLERNTKLPNISCVNSVFAVFPESSDQEQVSAMCDSVVSSNIIDESVDPSLWRNDFAFIRLQKSVDREPVKISRKGMKEGQVLTSIKVDYLDDQLGSLETSACSPLYNSYANPFSNHWSSPMVPVVDCEFSEGNLGAPLFNKKGELVSLISAKMDPALTSTIMDQNMLEEGVAPIQHTSNFACARVPLASEKDFVPNLECYKSIDYSRLDRLRGDILSSKKVHRKNIEKIREELEAKNKYFEWNVDFVSSEKGMTHEAHYGAPKCFTGIEEWLPEFSRTRFGTLTVYGYGFINLRHNAYTLRTKLNRYLKPVSSLSIGESKLYKVEFNPADAYFSGKTEVSVSAPLFGLDTTMKYSEVTDVCQP